MSSHYLETTCDGPDEFSCVNLYCVPDIVVCDGHDDCGDGSDEAGCGMYLLDESSILIFCITCLMYYHAI